MKKDTKSKKTARKTAKAKPVEFYIVSWAEYDSNTDQLCVGTFSQLYADYESARKAVFACMRDSLDDELENNGGPEDWKDEYGTSDKDEIFERNLVKQDDYNFTFFANGGESKYSIAKFTTAYIEGKRGKR